MLLLIYLLSNGLAKWISQISNDNLLEIPAALFSDVAIETHLVQRPLVLTRRLLHDGREERLRVEETR